jgi:MYXO-CTERM domain-containing protein
MKPRNGAIAALLFLTTCNEAEQDRNAANVESSSQALGKPAASEVATWKKVGGSNRPDGRYLQAVTFDETREVAVMFGGLVYDSSTGADAPNQETWEWSPVAGEWTNRTTTDARPAARSGAAMVFDSQRNKVILFGGRAGSGYNYQDTWEWDPTSGIWTDVTASGSRPSARSQHAMVYQKSTGTILLYGGGRSDSTSSDGSGISVSFGDTWEWDPVARTWAQRQPTDSPPGRYDLGLVWDSSRNKAVLFGGMQKDAAGVDGNPTQDTWEWDPATGTWTERTSQGTKPSPRYAHAMAFAGGINKAIVFGGWDIGTGGSLNDLWEWDPASGSWTSRLDGTESGIPSARMYASLVSDDSNARLELIAGATSNSTYGNGGMGGMSGPTTMPMPIPLMPTPYSPYGWQGTREVWEIDTATYVCRDRSASSKNPLPRSNHALAYNPTTGKTYVFGGIDAMQQAFDDLWEWDGKTWTKVITTAGPSARSDAGLAYDPVRKSLILYGGQNYQMGGMYDQTALGDTWEWSSTTRQWTQLSPTTSPDPLYSHGMVTDTTRNKILLFAGMSNYSYSPDGNYLDPMRNEVWEWDGSKLTWTNRTPVSGADAPSPRQYPILAYDEGRQKLFVEESSGYGYFGSGSNSTFWEWDPISAGWVMRSTGDYLDYGTPYCATYDSTRRREVVFGDIWSQTTTGIHETWELDAKGPTWYVRSITDSPSAGYGLAMAFDSARAVVVLFGGNANGAPMDETWEYSVTGLGNGEGCSTSAASACASGNCVDGVCCESTSCTGPCQSCSVSGHEGTCVLAQAGTEVPGSCSSGQACDGSGSCRTSNGQACSSASACASGFCVDGVCCDGACNGACVSCNQAGRAGKCSPYPLGSDPEKECSKGSGVCKSTCDGVGACVFPYGSACGSCLVCDGGGTCYLPDPNCGYGGYGGTGGYGYGGSSGYGGSYGYGGTYGSSYPYGGTTYGSSYPYGGTYGSSYPYGGTTYGSSYPYGGTYGSSYPYGGTTYGDITGGAGGIGGGAGSGGTRAGGAPGTGGGASGGTSSQLHRSGCSCALGGTPPASPGFATPVFLAGFALFLRRIRRSRR